VDIAATRRNDFDLGIGLQVGRFVQNDDLAMKMSAECLHRDHLARKLPLLKTIHNAGVPHNFLLSDFHRANLSNYRPFPFPAGLHYIQDVLNSSSGRPKGWRVNGSSVQPLRSRLAMGANETDPKKHGIRINHCVSARYMASAGRLSLLQSSLIKVNQGSCARLFQPLSLYEEGIARCC
jgi:hypothetical protein